MNFMMGEFTETGTVQFIGRELPDLPLIDQSATGPVSIGVRPEHIQSGSAGDFKFTATVSQAELLGAETPLYLRSDDDALIAMRAPGILSVRPDERAELSVTASDLRLLEGYPSGGNGRALLDYSGLGEAQPPDLQSKETVSKPE